MMLDVIMFFPSSFENYAWNKVMWLSAKFYKERQVMVNLLVNLSGSGNN